MALSTPFYKVVNLLLVNKTSWFCFKLIDKGNLPVFLLLLFLIFVYFWLYRAFIAQKINCLAGLSSSGALKG